MVVSKNTGRQSSVPVLSQGIAYHVLNIQDITWHWPQSNLVPHEGKNVTIKHREVTLTMKMSACYTLEDTWNFLLEQ